MEAFPERKLNAAISDILRPRRFRYLHTLWRELCSAVSRTEMSRKTNWMNHGIQLQHRKDPIEGKRLRCHNYGRARILGIQKLLSIHPAATKAEIQILCQIIGPELFEEAHHTAEESALHIPGTEETAR